MIYKRYVRVAYTNEIHMGGHLIYAYHPNQAIDDIIDNVIPHIYHELTIYGAQIASGLQVFDLETEDMTGRLIGELDQDILATLLSQHDLKYPRRG